MAEILLVLGDVLDLVDDPAIAGDKAHRYYSPGAILIEDGIVVEAGIAAEIKQKYAPKLALEDCRVIDHSGHLITPGFIDTHIHFPQTEMIAAYGEQLLSWLEKYAFPTEVQFSDPAYAKQIAELFLNELINNGTTTALVFGTVHPQSVDAFFSVAQKYNLRMIAGKVMMDRNCPDDLSDTAETGYTESKALIEKWHNQGRLSYAVTPRFAPTSSPEQLQKCQQLLAEYPDVYLHTHLSENKAECEWIKDLFPHEKNYLSVYDNAGLVKKRAVFAHGIYLDDSEYQCLANKQAALSHCPTSNLFIGSGLFNLAKCEHHKVTVGLGTDVGGGSSFSMLQTFNEAYKVQQLQDYKMSAFKGLYLATLGGAKALDLTAKIGNFLPGREADFVVFHNAPTPFLAFRLAKCTDLHERLFCSMMLGDDRMIKQTYILGKPAKNAAFYASTLYSSNNAQEELA
ncbi:guanine deaminase [Catenovulum sp. 2E275]|uniref:guanine deaminase n=1 Tax=Catenovulum sp. 2E275 TaxID=2980497 RepID=UPI0021D3DBDA|nr:guanine deaminase [Catenovulum sp. 2E275]MCU4676032.1 guanine deaminase [Catenovulum sp. 2E275]